MAPVLLVVLVLVCSRYLLGIKPTDFSRDRTNIKSCLAYSITGILFQNTVDVPFRLPVNPQAAASAFESISIGY